MKNLKDIYMYALGAIIVIGFFVTMVFLIRDSGYKSEVNMIVGALIATFTMVVSYFYGSSKGSADKTESVNKAAEELAKTQL